MHLFHLHWSPPEDAASRGKLIFWGENGNAKTPPKVRRSRDVRNHTFCSPPEELRSVLVDLGVLGRQQHISQDEVTLWLPTARFGPVPSPQLLHDWEEIDTEPSDLRQYVVSGLSLSLPMAFRLCMRRVSNKQRSSEYAFGDSLFFWQRTAQLVMELLISQKVSPGLLLGWDGSDEQFYARWLPVLDAPKDAIRLSQLMQVMPMLCQAEAESLDEVFTSEFLIRSFVFSMADAMSRVWGGRAVTQIQKHRDEGTAFYWMQSLVSKDALVTGTLAQGKHLAKSYKTWVRNLHVAGDPSFRIALRLRAPTNETENHKNRTWKIDFLLQARDDPSLWVPASQVWKSKGKSYKALEHRLVQPEQKLLTGLGYVARLFEPMNRALRQPKPSYLSLNAIEAYQFLRHVAPLLEESGFGVFVPPWWNRPSSSLGVKLEIGAKKKKGAGLNAGNLDLNALLRFRWDVVLGDEALSKNEFEALVAMKSPLVQIRGQWVHLDPQQVEAALKFWESQESEGEITLLEAMQMKASGESNIKGLEVHGINFEGWVKDWMDQFTRSASLEKLKSPKGLQATLRPYQEYGFSWLDFMKRFQLGACLADDMGLGKTLQTISMFLHDKENGSMKAPSLIVCPTSVMHNWAKEIQRFAPELSFELHHGAQRNKGDDLLDLLKQKNLMITSYSLVRRDADTLNKVKWHAVVLDEAQNIKNPDAQQTKAIHLLNANFRLALTGTPVENRLTELWSIMHFLNPGYLGKRKDFRKDFSTPIERYSDIKAQAKLKGLVGPFLLRRVKTDPSVIRDLPEKQEIKEYCSLSQEQTTLYQAIVESTMEQLAEAKGIQRKGMVLSLLMQLKQICNHPSLYLHEFEKGKISNELMTQANRSAKLSRLTEILDEAIAEDDAILIFTQFAQMGYLLRAQLQHQLGVPVLFLHGGTPAKKRSEMIKRFQEEGGPPIFVLSLKAGGTGLNLTRANRVVHYDRWWNPAVENQATDRAFRIGQTRNVLVHKFVCMGTLEERIDAMIEEKQALAESIVGQGENWLTELSSDELRNLVMLRRDEMMED